MISLDYRDARPIYEQITENFKRLIINGALSDDEKMPSVRTLATQLSINPNTIQRAYNELETEGFIYSVPGKGSFVCMRAEKQLERIGELKNQLFAVINELINLKVEGELVNSWISEGIKVSENKAVKEGEND